MLLAEFYHKKAVLNIFACYCKVHPDTRIALKVELVFLCLDSKTKKRYLLKYHDKQAL